MGIRCVYAVYFSATGNTRFVVQTIASLLSNGLHIPMEGIDFTTPVTREKIHSFTREELVVLGMPTYAGRLPNKLLPYVQSGFFGNHTPAVAVVTFGNRSYDNALAELCSCLNTRQFCTIAAGTFVAEHAFTRAIATGRPDEEDMTRLREFSSAIQTYLTNCSDFTAPVSVPGNADAPYYTPYGLDGRPANFLKARPRTDPTLCDGCGKCAVLCPMGSIDAANTANVSGICIKCHACVKCCPHHAKYFDDLAFLSHRAMLERDCQRRAESQWFCADQ